MAKIKKQAINKNLLNSKQWLNDLTNGMNVTSYHEQKCGQTSHIVKK